MTNCMQISDCDAMHKSNCENMLGTTAGIRLNRQIVFADDCIFQSSLLFIVTPSQILVINKPTTY